MKKNKTHKHVLRIILIIAVIVWAVVLSFYLLFSYFYHKTNYVSDTQISEAENSAQSDISSASTGLTPEEENQLKNTQSAAVADISVPESTGSYNLLLVGVDRRDSGWYGNSDSMILLSINYDKKEVHMISFMRDLYANIDGHGVHKLNAACAYGGCPLLVSTIEENYKVNIDNYAWVDFAGMIDIIDRIGGLDINITAEEEKVSNGYIQEMCALRGTDPSSHLFTAAGLIHMDGYQAVAYARNRYTGNSDYERTQRQRIVLSAIESRFKEMSLPDLTSAISDILPYITHNIDSGKMLQLTTQLPAILGYDMKEDRIPYDGMYSVKNEILIPDFEKTITKLQQELYS